MKRIPVSTYPSPVEIAERIEMLERGALHLPPTGENHQRIMRELASLRAYAAVAHWLRPLTRIPGVLKNQS
jgi:hypothetical protein